MRLLKQAPDIERILTRESVEPKRPALFAEAQIRRETVWVGMRDGIRLATDLYLPPILPTPAIAMRTPYGRAADSMLGRLLTLARRGYVVISQDCRGTGDSEPDVWDYYVYEPEDGFDLVEWVTQQAWFDGFLGAFGASYASATQWGMAAHPKMSAIVPEVGGLQVTWESVNRYMFVNGYPRAVGKGAHRLTVPYTEVERLIEEETKAGGYFNAPLIEPLPETVLERHPQLRARPLAYAKRRLWAHYCALPPRERVELAKELTGSSQFSFVEYIGLTNHFGGQTSYGAHTIPSASPKELCERFCAPALIITGWYDWNLGDQLPSWVALRREGHQEVASCSRLLITPAAHNMPGYHEGQGEHPELRHNHRYPIDLILRWFEALRTHQIDAWPTVIYYLMGANEWRVASDWPVREAKPIAFYLEEGGRLSTRIPASPSGPDRYCYDPSDPTPTVGGSILSYLYPPGSIDVSEVQRRADVVTYTTEPFDEALDVVGPLRLILYASSSAVDTDFAGRLSDVFPDGRAIQLQSGILRARHRNPEGEPELLEPGRVYRFEIDLWATANRFKTGHRLRLDIASADFPRFDRNANQGGREGSPLRATQSVYHDAHYPSHLLVQVLGQG